MRVVLCHTDEHADVFLKEGERLSSALPIRVHSVVATAFREAVCLRVEAEDIDFLLDEQGVQWQLYIPILPYLFASELRDIGKAEAEKIIEHHKKAKRD